MGFTVEQECPQCGAQLELDETDHLLQCPYCDVRNYLFTPDYFRYVLPDKAPGKEIIYAPYLRFRGNVYFCSGMTISHRIVDITNAGIVFKGIPVSLGLRPQALKMKFASPGTECSFLRFTLDAADIIARAGKPGTGSSDKSNILHRAYIGETMSIIYLPLYEDRGRLFDAVLNRPVSALPLDRESLDKDIIKEPGWDVTFVPTICPQCGWNMDGEKDSVVMVCGNCGTAWEAGKGKFKRVDFSIAQGGDNCEYLPFWKISAIAQGVEIKTFADFVRITNQPRVAGAEWEDKVMSFWSPAFKIRPGVFLNLSRQFTISQRNFQVSDTMPDNKHLHPVTLPASEAKQALKIILAGSAVNKKSIFPNLPQIRFDIKAASLIYLPFIDNGHELMQEQTGINMNKNALEFGRRL